MNRPVSWLIVGVVALLALVVRFYELDRSAVRSDEINFLNLAAQKQSVAQLWKNPPWMNQIPLADSVAVVWHWVRPGTPNEQSVREPFALIGWLTVVGCMIWLTRRRGLAAGVMVGIWMGLLPFHVYQSREAYYYVVVMAFASGLTLYSADLIARLRTRAPLNVRAYVIWTAWAIATCLTHMSTWVIAAILWILLLLEGSTKVTPAIRRRHVMHLMASGGVIAVVMLRWIWRAYLETQKVSQADGHLGGAFGWVGLRVIPFFTAGANAIGVTVSLVLLMCLVGMTMVGFRRKNHMRDPLFGALTIIVLAGFAAAYTYIGLVGGGAAKISYFTALLPVFLVWACYLLDRLASLLPGKLAAVTPVAISLALTGVLLMPAWMVTRLDGKPVPYKVIRSWLDEHLDPGSVVVVDRWYEPWNEMARYAPSNVVVTFTVPDEPYEYYRQLQWRDVTRAAIESGRVQAFIRLTRNHENREGLWTWPESYFAKKAVLKNEAGLWARENGYAANEDFYAANTNRLIAEIFYDLHEDAVARLRRNNTDGFVFFGPGLTYMKSGPMGARLQTQQFMDWRVMEKQGELNLFNATDLPFTVMVAVSAVSPNGSKLVDAGSYGKFKFSGGQLQQWRFGPVVLQPGDNRVVLQDPLWDKVQSMLLISTVEMQKQ